MTHHVRVRETGEWVAGPIDPDEMELIDSQLFGSIDGDAGGDWSPAAAINLGGAYGLTLSTSTPLTANGAVQIGASTSTHLYVDSTSHFYGPATSSGGFTVSAGTFTVSGTGTVLNTATYLNGTTNVTGQINLKHSATFGDALSHVFTLLGVLSMGDDPPVGYNNGRIRLNVAVTQLSGNTSHGVTSSPAITAVTNLNGGSRTVTLLHADAGNGDFAIYINKDSTYNITVFDETAGAIAGAILPGGMCLAFYEADTGRWYGSACNP
jgi:hypothetical protein